MRIDFYARIKFYNLGDISFQPDKPAEDPFDTTISGPWMGKWEIVHMNKHVERYLRDEGLPIPTNVQ